jgi:hypothetical protein
MIININNMAEAESYEMRWHSDTWLRRVVIDLREIVKIMKLIFRWIVVQQDGGQAKILFSFRVLNRN